MKNKIIENIKKKIARRKEYITLEEVKIINYYNNISYIPKRNKVNMVIGGLCVGVGCVTLPLPTGSIFLIMFGIGFFNNPHKLSTIYNILKRKLKRIVRGYI